MKGINRDTSSGMTNRCAKRTKALALPAPRPVPGLGRAARLPFRLARWLPVGAFDGRGHENDDRTLSKVRHQCFGQYERPEVVRGMRHIPAACVLRGTRLKDACVVDQPGKGKFQANDGVRVRLLDSFSCVGISSTIAIN